MLEREHYTVPVDPGYPEHTSQRIIDKIAEVDDEEPMHVFMQIVKIIGNVKPGQFTNDMEKEVVATQPLAEISSEEITKAVRALYQEGKDHVEQGKFNYQVVFYGKRSVKRTNV